MSAIISQSVAERGIKSAKEVLELLRLGGFPEPFPSGSETEARRQSREYRTLLVREKIAMLDHLDWQIVPQDPVRFENLVACHLLKLVHFWKDTEGRDMELRHFRDIEGREVDFVVTESRRPRLFVECK